jgi:hypothetical protein
VAEQRLGDEITTKHPSIRTYRVSCLIRDRISFKEEKINPEDPYTAHHESVNLITPVPRVVRHPLRFEYADDAQYGRDTLFSMKFYL